MLLIFGLENLGIFIQRYGRFFMCFSIRFEDIVVISIPIWDLLNDISPLPGYISKRVMTPA